MDWTSTTDRRVGALAHLGIPLWGPILPFIVWLLYRTFPFRREHARQAFVFQCCFFVPYSVAAVLMVTRDFDPTVPVIMLAVGLLLELPQVARALAGRRPMRVIPFDLLPE